MDLKVHHIGYAVSDIEKAQKSFESLGYTACGPVTDDYIRNVKIVFMKTGDTTVELVAPDGEPNPVDGVLKKNGSTPYHICYVTDDMNESIQDLKKSGYMVIKKPEAAPAIDNCNVAFLYSAAAGMIELAEIKE